SRVGLALPDCPITRVCRRCANGRRTLQAMSLTRADYLIYVTHVYRISVRLESRKEHAAFTIRRMDAAVRGERWHLVGRPCSDRVMPMDSMVLLQAGFTSKPAIDSRMLMQAHDIRESRIPLLLSSRGLAI